MLDLFASKDFAGTQISAPSSLATGQYPDEPEAGSGASLHAHPGEGLPLWHDPFRIGCREQPYLGRDNIWDTAQCVRRFDKHAAPGSAGPRMGLPLLAFPVQVE